MADMQPPSSPPSSAAVEPVLAAQDAYLQEQLLSSPPRSGTASGSSSSKERRQPSITPRKFRRFFTPRVSASFPTPARRALRDLTARAINNAQSSPASAAAPFGSSSFHFNSSPLAAAAVRHVGNENELDGDDTAGDDEQLELPQASSRPSKRRKTGHQTPETSPTRPSTSKYLDAITPKPVTKTKDFTSMLLSPLDSSPFPAIADADEPMSEDDNHVSHRFGHAEPEVTFPDPPVKRIVRFAERGFAGQVLQRETSCQVGGIHHARRPATDWKIDTANFYTSKDDVHVCVSHDTPNERCIPFCAAACNTNGMVAIGDEEGRVRLLDSSRDSKDGFDYIFLSFVAHGNAVIDLAFSEDDYLLATASGDQTGRVIDIKTQTPVSILDHHTASLKQVRFQPGKGEGNVLATSGRDGSIKIWDLRCHGGPAQELTVEGFSRGLRYSLPRKINQGCVVNSIYDAHTRATRQTRQSRKSVLANDVTTRWEEPGRVGEVSVTAIQFMPAGKEHLLLSACEADASIKLWDIRHIHTSRQKASSTPLSYTAAPESHSQWRPFGMSSLSLSTDGARLFGLCKDNTVYAYATSHLMLGSAPELTSKAPDHPRRRNGVVQEGLGPLYGFRHEKFHATSFYVKTALRPAKDGRPEMLAVGSSDGSPILFPTDERYFMGAGDMYDNGMQSADQEQSATPIFTAPRTVGSRSNSPAPRRAGGLFRTNSMSSLQGGSSGRLVDTVPIVRNGTPLVRGHEPREVGAVCWTNEGSLVTVGDDQYIRCWREGGDFEEGLAARDLRRGGEREGRRWMAGWADVGDDWDGDDGDDEGDDWIID